MADTLVTETNPYPQFYWVRDKSRGEVTVARDIDGRWYVFGGMEGWSTAEEIATYYDVLGRVSTVPVKA